MLCFQLKALSLQKNFEDFLQVIVNQVNAKKWRGREAELTII